tara:strand:+ start:225 stop:659 length:435 start_codon:yes stop_codon:yes gene_type:complete
MYKDYEIKLNAILDKHKGVQKVELGLVDDLEKSIDKINKDNSNLKKHIQNIQKAEQKFETTYQKARDLTENVYDNALKDYDNSRLVISTAEKYVKEIMVSAKELGINPQDIKAIKEFKDAEKQHETVTDKIEIGLSNLKDIFAD